jgi:UV DNA damage endonuclease
MILHMGGTFGDKEATLDRFRSNYKDLSQSIKQRLVLENDDVSWSVHDLLPVCEELNIPLCLDFHHHNIIFDSTQVREGTHGIIGLFPRIKATWDRKNIKQKMHYSEPTPDAITGRQRRKHNPRPITLPPCPNDMDLMIEAKDKEQAVFELMRTFKLPGWDTFNNVIPFERSDDNKPLPQKAKKKKTKKQIAAEIEEFGKELSDEEEAMKEQIPEGDVSMGGKEDRVYWPVGMEEWLRPKKREVKKKAAEDEETMFKNPTPANFAARKAITARNRAPLSEDMRTKLGNANSVEDVQKLLGDAAQTMTAAGEGVEMGNIAAANKRSNPATQKVSKRKVVKDISTPALSDIEDDEELSMPDLSTGEDDEAPVIKAPASSRANGSGRPKLRGRGQRKSYAESDGGLSGAE